MSSYFTLFVLILLSSLASALLGPWIFAALAVGIIFWLLVDRPIVSLSALFLGIIAGQMVRIPIGGGTIVISDLILFAVVFAWFLRKTVRREKFFFSNPLNFPLIILNVTMALSLIWAAVYLPSGAVIGGSLYFFRFLAYQMVFFFVQSSIKDIRQAKTIFNVILGTGVALSVLGFAQLIIMPDFSSMVPEGWDPHVGRLLSTWFDPNLLGGLFAFLALVVIAQMIINKMSFWKITTLAVFIGALLLTFSRSSLVAFAFGFFIIITLTVKRSWWLLVLGSAAMIAAFLSSPRIQERVQGIITIDVTAQKRFESWSNVMQIVREHPLLGVGFNTLRYVQFENGLTPDPNEHSAGGSDSSFLTILATTGIFGFLTFIWLWVSALFVSWKIFAQKQNNFNAALGLGIIGGLASLFVHSQFVNSLLYPHILVVVWVILGIAVWMYQNENKTKI